MKDIKQILESEGYINEGVYDKNIFKAIFLAGGPGSGKSFTSGAAAEKWGLVFRNPKGADDKFIGLGLKISNSDELFEKMVTDAGLTLDMASDRGEREEEARDLVRKRAKAITSKRKDLWVAGRLGLIIDGTGHDYDKIQSARKDLEKIGYDTSMIFVNTSLDVAQERNLERERTVKAKIVKQSWLDVQKNIGKFQSLFGQGNYIVVDNNEYSEDNLNYVAKTIKRFLNKPVENHIAKQWIKAELDAKKSK